MAICQPNRLRIVREYGNLRDWQRATDHRTFRWPWLDFEARANEARAIVHRPQSHPLFIWEWFRKREPVVFNRYDQVVFPMSKAEDDLPGLPMLQCVADCLLHNVINVSAHNGVDF